MPVAEHAAAGLADGGLGAEHVVALAAEFVVDVVVVAAGAVPAAGLAVELADGLAAGQLAELEPEPVGAVCRSCFLDEKRTRY